MSWLISKAATTPRKLPRFIRAQLYDYLFTSRAERAMTGEIWKQESLGVYLPVVSLDQKQSA